MRPIRLLYQFGRATPRSRWSGPLLGRLANIEHDPACSLIECDAGTAQLEGYQPLDLICSLCNRLCFALDPAYLTKRATRFLDPSLDGRHVDPALISEAHQEGGPGPSVGGF